MITAFCPTYGRFELLRDAVACFLLQTYRPRRLLVLNDAPEPVRLTEDGGPLRLPGCTVEVWNSDSRYPTLGHKRQALLTAACGDPKPVEGGISDGQTDQSHSTPRPRQLAAHWDDDDWYLPWHLAQCVQGIRESGADCGKPRGAWFVKGPRDNIRVTGPKHNVHEAQMVFRREAALQLGGYSHEDSGQAKSLMGRFKKQGTFKKFEPWAISLCVRWANGTRHVSSVQDRDRWREANRDFCEGEPLLPTDKPFVWARARVKPLCDQLVRCLEEIAPREDVLKISEHLP